MSTTKKITAATFKSFVKKNAEQLHINIQSKFDGMTDGVERQKEGFTPATKNDWSTAEYIAAHTLGYVGIWLVGSSRDHFNSFENERFTGIQVYNACGSFVVATPKN